MWNNRYPERLIALVCCIVLTLAGCSKVSKMESSTSPASGTVSNAKYRVVAMLSDNNELLSKYVTGSGNALIALAGLGALMEEVKSESEKAVHCAQRCLSLVPACVDDTMLERYGDDFEKIKLSFNAENDKLKAAKKARDIGSIENSLQTLSLEIQEYNTLLEQFENELE